MKREIDQTVRRSVEQGIADGTIAAGDPRLVAFTLTGALNWIGRWYDPAGPLTAQQVAEGCVATLIAGLAARRAEETG